MLHREQHGNTPNTGRQEVGNVYSNEESTTSSWIQDRSVCRIQCSDSVVNVRVHSWAFARLIGFGVNCPIKIYSIPKRKWRWVLKNLGISGPEKKLNRVEHGMRLGKQRAKIWAEDHSQLDINDYTDTISNQLAEEGKL